MRCIIILAQTICVLETNSNRDCLLHLEPNILSRIVFVCNNTPFVLPSVYNKLTWQFEWNEDELFR